jgi:hypothetical protein
LPTPLSTLKGLSPRSFSQLVGWKLLQRARHAVDAGGGSGRLARRGERWGRRWLGEFEGPGIGAWLGRPSAGVWWFEPSPLAWALDTCTRADVDLADAALRGEFTLLGATTAAAAEPAWRRDLYSGREWPLDASHRLQVVRGDGSDIRTVWELSRCYHFIALARANASAGDARYAEPFARHVESFIADNPLGYGPHWASPMDVAIRAANWSLVIPLFAGAPLPAHFWATMLGNLYSSGLFIERYLEWHPVYRGNHYVANLTGLVYLGTLFRGSRAGNRWLRLGARGLRNELAYQVCDDGVSFEASLAYHRLVTEMFAWSGELLTRNAKRHDAAAFERVVRRMAGFIGTYLPPDGQAPMIGDADDGRLHAVTAQSLTEPRRHDLGLPATLPVEAPGDGAFPFPHGGFFVLRHGAHHAVIRCGPVGLRGAGSHDHNDQLAFELVVAGRRIVRDSGTFVYTRDLAARFRYRATAAHSVVQLGGREQNEIRADKPWRILEERTHSTCTVCEAVPGRLRFAGEHAGYASLPNAPLCRRELSLDTESGSWRLADDVTGKGRIDVAWRLHLEADLVELQRDAPGRARVTCAGEPAISITVEYPAEMAVAVLSAERSDAYGLDRTGPVLVISGVATLPLHIHCTIQQES